MEYLPEGFQFLQLFIVVVGILSIIFQNELRTKEEADEEIPNTQC